MEAERAHLLRQWAVVVLPPLFLFLAAVILSPPDWRVAAFVAALWYLLPAVRGRVLLAYVALLSSCVIWLLLSSDTSLALPAGLLPLLLASLLPGKKRGAGDDFNPAPGVTR